MSFPAQTYLLAHATVINNDFKCKIKQNFFISCLMPFIHQHAHCMINSLNSSLVVIHTCAVVTESSYLIRLIQSTPPTAPSPAYPLNYMRFGFGDAALLYPGGAARAESRCLWFRCASPWSKSCWVTSMPTATRLLLKRSLPISSLQ